MVSENFGVSSIQASAFEAKVRVEAARFDLSSLPEDLRRQMKQLTYKQLQKEELTELNRIISGTESDHIGDICPRLRDLRTPKAPNVYVYPA